MAKVIARRNGRLYRLECRVSLHSCDLSDYPFDGYGEAVTSCEEREDGTLWVGNSEYGTQVNFCPACGFAAKAKVMANAESEAPSE